MKKNLENVLEDFLNNFDAKEINEYFANDFYSDWDVYLENGASIDVLEYLNDAFCDIDINYRNTNMFENKVFNALHSALKYYKEKRS